jgi:hypothetical protein
MQGDALPFDNFLDMKIKTQQVCWQQIAHIPMSLVPLLGHNIFEISQ